MQLMILCREVHFKSKLIGYGCSYQEYILTGHCWRRQMIFGRNCLSGTSCIVMKHEGNQNDSSKCVWYGGFQMIGLINVAR